MEADAKGGMKRNTGVPNRRSDLAGIRDRRADITCVHNNVLTGVHGCSKCSSFKVPKSGFKPLSRRSEERHYQRLWELTSVGFLNHNPDCLHLNFSDNPSLQAWVRPAERMFVGKSVCHRDV